MKEPLQRSECKFCLYPVNLQIKHFTLSLHEPFQFPVTYSTAKVLLKSRDCSSSLLLLLRVSFFLIKVLVKQDIHSVFNFTGWWPARSQVCITARGAKPNRRTLQMLSNCSPGKLVYVKASKQKNPANPVPIDRMYSFTRKKQVGGVRHQHVCRYLYQSNTHTHTHLLFSTMALKLSADDMISEMNYGRRRREEPINTMVSVSRRKQGRVEKIGKRRWRRRRLARGLCFKDDSERAWGGLTPCSSQSTSSFLLSLYRMERLKWSRTNQKSTSLPWQQVLLDWLNIQGNK